MEEEWLANTSGFAALVYNRCSSIKRGPFLYNNQHTNEFRNSLVSLPLCRLYADLLQGEECMTCLPQPASSAAVIQPLSQGFPLILESERTGGSAQA